jgi:hypothetical protein
MGWDGCTRLPRLCYDLQGKVAGSGMSWEGLLGWGRGQPCKPGASDARLTAHLIRHAGTACHWLCWLILGLQVHGEGSGMSCTELQGWGRGQPCKPGPHASAD